MHSIHEIINEINESNKTNHKIAVLKKYKDDYFLQRILKMTYDRVKFTYGITMKNINYMPESKFDSNYSLSEALDILENSFSTRLITGNNANDLLTNTLEKLSSEDAILIEKIIGRDLKINIGKTQINKIWKGLITKPGYMRCGVYSEKTAKDINFNAILQLKADGTYREFSVLNKIIESRSRSGESYVYPNISEEMSEYLNGIYTGELTVCCDDIIAEKLKKESEKLHKKGEDTEAIDIALKKYSEHKKNNKEYILPRGIGNGLINSDDVPHNNLILDLWDYITHDEYQAAINREKTSIPYIDRFNQLRSIVKNNKGPIRVIETHEVKNIKEALLQVSAWVEEGLEGGVLKDMNGVFKDGTSKYQLKLKLIIDAEMRILDFNPGNIGTKREGKVGSVIFGNDEGTIKGKCSGFSDEILDDMTENPDKYLNKIFTVEFNDISKAKGNDYYAFSHPRWIELRTDKNETDTLEKVLESKEMALNIEEKMLKNHINELLNDLKMLQNKNMSKTIQKKITKIEKELETLKKLNPEYFI